MQRVLLLFGSMLFCMVAMAQSTINVSGTVTSPEGTAVPASVTVKGTTRGTTTDSRGHYTLTNVPSSATIVITSIGFKTHEEVVGGRTEINVTLQYDAQALDEVIAVAYGTSTKGTFTGAADVVNAKDIENYPATSFQSALVGKAPGVQVTSSSGQAGSVSSIRIRGIGSMNASNEPLYVIDGVPVPRGSSGQLSGYIYSTNNVMNTLNPNDIESITILKDAAASVLYGSRAANGVVMITTKKGRLGKPRINLSSSYGMSPSWATDNYEAAGTQEQVNMLYQVFYDYNLSLGRNETLANSDALRRLNVKFNRHGYKFSTAGTGRYDNVDITGMTDGIENREGKYFDWDKALFRTGHFQNHSLSVTGGDEGTKYYTSISYTKDQNRVYVNEFDRINGRLNFSQKIGRIFEVSSNIGVSSGNQEGFNDTRNLGGNFFMQTRNLLWGLYWPNDYKTGQPFTARLGSLAYNPVYYNTQWENNARTVRLIANEALSVNLLPSLKLKTVLSYDNINTQEHLYYSPKHYSGSNDNGVVHDIRTNLKTLVSSTTANFVKSFGDHNIDVLAGFEAEKSVTDFSRATGKDLPNSELHTVATAGKFEANAYSFGYSMNSYLSRAEYNYQQKYFASASFRRDGSSRLSPTTRWGDFWSVAGAWRISSEDFLRDNASISNLRLRASYGVNGTMPSNNYGWRSLVVYNRVYNDQAGGTIQTIADENLKWEQNYTANVAVEFGLFNQRLFGTVEFFNRNSENVLQDVPISGATGFTSTLRNVGKMNNRGLELTLGGDIVRNNVVRWGIVANASFIKSKVVQLYAAEGQTKANDIIWEDPTGGDDRAQFIYREGESTLSFYGYEWAGVDPDNGKNRWYVNDPSSKTAGDFLLNGRGASYDFGTANYIILGSAIPKVFGGLSSDVQYRDFTLNMNFIYKIGGYIYDGAYKDVADDGYYWERIRAQSEWDNAWTETNKNGSLPQLSGEDLTDPQQYSSRQMTDASFLRLKTITLGYNIPASVVNKIGINNINVFATAANLWTISKYKEADPEVNNYGTRGWETPYAKSFTFGINLNF